MVGENVTAVSDPVACFSNSMQPEDDVGVIETEMSQTDRLSLE